MRGKHKEKVTLNSRVSIALHTQKAWSKASNEAGAGLEVKKKSEDAARGILKKKNSLSRQQIWTDECTLS